MGEIWGQLRSSLGKCIDENGLKKEDNLKNEDHLKNEDEIKNENDLKNEDQSKKNCPPPLKRILPEFFFDDLSPQQPQDN